MVEMKREKVNEVHEVRSAKAFTKFRGLIAGLGLATVVAVHGCGNNDSQGVPPVPACDAGDATCTDAGPTDGGTGGMDGGRCINPSPVCEDLAIANRQLNVGDVLVVEGYLFRLTDTGEASGNQWAKFDVLDSCGNVLLSNQTIQRDAPQTIHVTGTNMDVRMGASAITVLNPKTATLNVTVTCEMDGGTTDAGTGGMDGGTGGMDAGTGGMDAGVDAGGHDGGMGGMDAGVDGGMSGCSGLVNDTRTGSWFLNADTAVGASGLNARYIGQTSTQCVFEFRCIASGNSVIITGQDLVVGSADTAPLTGTVKRVDSSLSGKNGSACNGTLSVNNL